MTRRAAVKRAERAAVNNRIRAAATTIQRVVRGVRTRRLLRLEKLEKLEKLEEYFKKHHIHTKSFLKYIYEHGRRTLTKNMISYIFMLDQNGLKFQAKELIKLCFYGPQLETFFKQHSDVPVQFRMKLIRQYIGSCHTPKTNENAKEFISVLLNQLRLISDLYFKNENEFLSTQKNIHKSVSWRNVQGVATVTGATYGGLYGLFTGTPMTGALTGAVIGGIGVPLVKNRIGKALYRENYIKLLKKRSGNFPCLNNLLEEMLSTVSGETFNWPWKTKNVGNLNNKNSKNGYPSKYIKIMFNGITTIKNSDPTFSETNNKFSKLSTNQQINAYWSKLKSQQMYKNGHLLLVSNYNKNGTKFKTGYKLIMGN